MSQRPYELVFILPPSLAEDEINSVQEHIIGWITDQGGNIIKTSPWGRRRLAYSIQNYKEGYYFEIDFNAETSSIKDLERRLRLEPGVIRHLIVQDEAQ
ncbi:MAG TPA: 30S ribosomal protein S6 [Aggregatilineales bacterium]|nr:30S ribosomal protein S6 [Aggregatilineales bacterium]